MDDKLMHVQAVADYLGVSKARIYETWKVWNLPFFKVGQTLRMRAADLEAWINDQKRVN